MKKFENIDFLQWSENYTRNSWNQYSRMFKLKQAVRSVNYLHKDGH